MEKGAAYIAEGTPAKYMAVDISEFCENKIAYLNGLKEELENRIPKNIDDADGYIIISGQRHMQPGRIGLIVDSKVVLTGEIGGSNSCLYSKKKNLVHLFKTSLKNEIKLIAVTERRLQS